MFESSHLSLNRVYSSLHLPKDTVLDVFEKAIQTPFEKFVDNVWSVAGLLSWEYVQQYTVTLWVRCNCDEEVKLPVSGCYGKGIKIAFVEVPGATSV